MFFYLVNLHPMMTMMPWPGLDVTPVVDAFSAHPGTVFEDIDLTNPLPGDRNGSRFGKTVEADDLKV
jgi:hypothetical protein